MQEKISEKAAAEKAFFEFLKQNKREIRFGFISAIIAVFLTLAEPFVDSKLAEGLRWASLVVALIDLFIVLIVFRSWWKTIGKEMRARRGRIHKQSIDKSVR